MKRTLLHALCLLLPVGAALSQTMTLVSGSIHILEGTSMRLENVQALSLAAGTSVVNDGDIDLGTSAVLQEPIGGPITGSGTERAQMTVLAPFTGAEPGGLGLTLGSTDVTGPLHVVRGHMPFAFAQGDQSIARWFEISTASGNALDVELRYDATELNNLSEASLSLFKSNSTNGPWTALASSVNVVDHVLTGSEQTPWNLITAFDMNAPTFSPTMVAQDGFQVWPTLAIDVINVLSLSTETISTLEIFDATGRTVAGSGIQHTGSHRTMNVGQLTNGTFFLRVNGVHVFKFRKA